MYKGFQRAPLFGVTGAAPTLRTPPCERALIRTARPALKGHKEGAERVVMQCSRWSGVRPVKPLAFKIRLF